MNNLEFKKNVEPICKTDNFWYMLTDGGYLKPDDYLKPESAKKVKEAIKIVKQFEEEMQDRELFEDY